MTALLVALGAAVGAPMRYLVNHRMRERWATTPAAGTLTVNVIGSLVLGCLAGAAVGGSWMALFGIGFCGAFTTFSTLALELQDAFTDGRARRQRRAPPRARSRRCLARLAAQPLIGVALPPTGSMLGPSEHPNLCLSAL